LEKIVANVISNSNIRFLIVCGVESKGHLPGNTLLALHKNGIDEKGRIIGSKGAIPFIQNLSVQAVERFQRQVKLIDRIGLEDMNEIERLVSQYNYLAMPFPEEPYQVIKRKAPRQEMLSGDSDLTFGAGVSMDTTRWLVASEG
jgi:tetrahydromethanopterin S-methyltransferase subunit A